MQTSMRLHDIDPGLLSLACDLDAGTLADRPVTRRHLADLRGAFADSAAWERRLAENPLLYTVASMDAAGGEGQLHYGLGVLHPGKVGDEYFLTKGHYHEDRACAEVYVGLRGEGLMLLEDEESPECRSVALGAGRVVYVPGFTAHRTVNTGSEPLVYLGIYPSHAGHDYGSLAERNFKQVVVEREGRPAVVLRDSL